MWYYIDYKDEVLLQNIHLLIDATTGHGMLFIIEKFTTYNQIRMYMNDAKKNSFQNSMDSLH